MLLREPRRCIALLVVSLATGCASVSPWNQSFIEVRTLNFVVTTSFGEDAARTLATELEALHAGVLYAVGLAPDARLPAPTRVVAFDDRGFGRPFAIRSEVASLLPGVEAPTLVIRAPGTFAERIRPEVRHRYARHVLRALSAERAPLWYAAGRARLAAAIRVSGTLAEIGRGDPALARQILDWRRGDLTNVFGVTSLVDRSNASRREFEATSWALVHTVLFDGPRSQPGRQALDQVRRAFESARPGALAAATDRLGAREALAERVYTHLASERHRIDRVQVAGLDETAISVRPLTPSTARSRLAALALALERPALALDYLDRALEASPADTLADARRALALAMLGRSEEALATLRRLPDALEPEPGWTAGQAAIRVAMSTSDASTQAAALALGRRRLFLVADSDRASGFAASAWVELARSALVDDDARDLADEAVEAARRLAPGALEVDVVAAELHAAAGRSRAARHLAGEVVSRSDEGRLRTRARALLD